MKLLKADNYQTWLIEEADIAVLIDPWLSKQLQPDNSIFIQRKKSQASLLNDEDYEKVQAIIITAPFEDHLHIESIRVCATVAVGSTSPSHTSSIEHQD